MTESETDIKPRARLLAAATALIAREGLEGLDVRKVVEIAETSTSQFARSYKHKDDLVAAVFNSGWLALQQYISLRLMKPSSSIEDVVEGVLNGVLDGLENEKETVSAALIIAHASVGQSVTVQLRGTVAHGRFFLMVDQLRAEFARKLTREQAIEALELLYGAALHRLVLSTPLCQATAPPFNRETFIHLMRLMANSLVAGGPTHSPDSKQAS